MARAFNGHKNWNHWNVSLWLNNDESLYTLMCHYIKWCRTKNDAAKALCADLKSGLYGETKTKDGATYSISAIRAAMRGIEV